MAGEILLSIYQQYMDQGIQESTKICGRQPLKKLK